MSILATTADPLLRLPAAERPAYATGMLLDAQDFAAEQVYHRGRLARALLFVAGGGTLAGLKVSHEPVAPDHPDEEISVGAGLALDRLGRLIELPRRVCLRLARWLDALRAADPGSGNDLTQYVQQQLDRFISPRLADAIAAGTQPALPARALVADVYIRFALCRAGLTPAFATGPYDALDAASAARLRDAWEVLLLPRPQLADDYTGLPAAPGPAVLGNAGASAAERRDALQDTLFGAYEQLLQPATDGSPGLAPAPEHAPGMDTSAVFLARVFVPLLPDSLERDPAATPLVDNGARRFLPAQALLAQWNGL